MEDTIIDEVFTLPAKPWGEVEIAYIMAHQFDLDEDTKKEMGIIPYIFVEKAKKDETK